jgi:Carbohydrate esterase, sialic acid-specific acetylesterase
VRIAVAALAAVLALLAARDAAAARQRYGVDAFVLAGQSNMLGSSTQFENWKIGRVTSPAPNGLRSFAFRARGDNQWSMANEFPCDDSECHGSACDYLGPNRTVDIHPQFYDQGEGTCWCTCGVHYPAHFTNADAGRGSAWPTFAQLWMERGRQAFFVSTAVGAQCLVAAPSWPQPTWDPDAADCDSIPPYSYGELALSPTRPGELFCRMLQAVELSNAKPLRAVLLLQGECDATARVDYATYKATLGRFADAVWERLRVPVIAAPISRHTRPGDACPPYEQIDVIAQATIDAANEHPHVFLGPLSDDLLIEADCIHTNDVITLGQRWFKAVMAAGVAP